MGDGNNLVDLTYVENVIQALMLALDASAAIGNTYTITNDEHVPLWDIVRSVLSRLNLSTKLRRVPLSVALAAASLMELRAALTGQEPLLTRYTAAILAHTQKRTTLVLQSAILATLLASPLPMALNARLKLGRGKHGWDPPDLAMPYS